MKIFIGVVVWLGISFFLGIFAANAFGHGGIIMVYAATFLGVCGALVQGLFIKAKYYRLGAAVSLIAVGALTFVATLLTFGLLLATTDSQHLLDEIWFFAQLLFIPCFAISAITYFITERAKSA